MRRPISPWLLNDVSRYDMTASIPHFVQAQAKQTTPRQHPTNPSSAMAASLTRMVMGKSVDSGIVLGSSTERGSPGVANIPTSSMTLTGSGEASLTMTGLGEAGRLKCWGYCLTSPLSSCFTKTGLPLEEGLEVIWGGSVLVTADLVVTAS